jgi:peptidyl-Lys metalloendopeptidase
MIRRYVGWMALGGVVLGAAGCGGSQPQAPAGEGSSAQPAGTDAPTPGTPSAQGTTEEGSTMAKLECSMSVAQSVKAGQPVELQFRLSNRGTRPVYVLNWQTPFESRPLGNYLQVTRDGADVAYQGALAKRGDPSESSYVTIAPGVSAEGKVDVGLSYDMKKPGHYRIAFRNTLMDVITDKAEVPHKLDQLRAAEVSCAPVETTITPP